jgi:hypothetical protein
MGIKSVSIPKQSGIHHQKMASPDAPEKLSEYVDIAAMSPQTDRSASSLRIARGGTARLFISGASPLVYIVHRQSVLQTLQGLRLLSC